LPLEFALAPSFPDAYPQVELAFLLAPAAAQDEQVVGPGQFSHQWCEFWRAAVGLEELPHPPQVACREASSTRLTLLDVLGKGSDSTFTPALGCDLVTDVLADLPIEVDQDRVDGGEGPRPGGFDEAHYFLEVRLRWLIRLDSFGDSLPGGFPG